MAKAWWRGGVLYEIYPRSWRDNDGDGIGDLAGVPEKRYALMLLLLLRGTPILYYGDEISMTAPAPELRRREPSLISAGCSSGMRRAASPCGSAATA